MKKKFRRFSGFAFWDGLGLGVLIGVVSSICLFWIVEDKSELITKNWVSIFAIIASLLAAYLALQGNRSQLNHTAEIDDKNQTNQLIAAKAELASALSSLSSIAQQQVEFLVNYKHPQNRPALNPRPDEYDAIKECIQFSDPNSQKWLALIMMRYQVVAARANTPLCGTIAAHGEQTADGMDLIYSAIDWAEYKAIVENVFNFARGEEPAILSFDSSRISSSFFLLNIRTNGTPKFQEMLQHRVNLREDATPNDWFG